MVPNFYLLMAYLIGTIAGNYLRSDEEVLAAFRKEKYLQQGDMFIRPPSKNKNERMDWDIYDNWPDNTIPYVVSENVTKELRPVINESIDYLNNYTCLKFRPANTKKDYYWIRFLMHPDIAQNPNSSLMCAAVANFQENKDQGVFLGSRCNTPAMIHELLHSVGLYHEHNRNDRDQFITVHLQNMTEEGKGQYIKDKERCLMEGFRENLCTMKDYGLNYNYGSLMHYCQLCGSIDGKSHVYTLLNNKKALGNPKNVGQPLA